jgi:hypothetical protein
VHALLPSEPAYAVVELQGAEQARCQTAAVQPEATRTVWQETLEFDYEGSTPRNLHVEVHGKLRDGADDLVAAGDLDLCDILESGTRQVVEVALKKAGRELGQLELCIQHQAMPEAK